MPVTVSSLHLPQFIIIYLLVSLLIAHRLPAGRFWDHWWYFSECGPGTSIISVTREHVSHAESDLLLSVHPFPSPSSPRRTNINQ